MTRIVLLMVWALALGAALVFAVACEPVSSPLAPSVVQNVNTPSGGAVDICEAIRSGRIKPLVRVPGC